MRTPKSRLRMSTLRCRRRLETSDSGFYRIGELAPGNYKLVVEAKGFKASTIENVAVTAEQMRGLDVTLQVGDVTQSVTVNGSCRAESSE